MTSVPLSKADKAHLKSSQLSHSHFSSFKTVGKFHCPDGKEPSSHLLV